MVSLGKVWKCEKCHGQQKPGQDTLSKILGVDCKGASRVKGSTKLVPVPKSQSLLCFQTAKNNVSSAAVATGEVAGRSREVAQQPSGHAKHPSEDGSTAPFPGTRKRGRLHKGLRELAGAFLKEADVVQLERRQRLRLQDLPKKGRGHHAGSSKPAQNRTLESCHRSCSPPAAAAEGWV